MRGADPAGTGQPVAVDDEIERPSASDIVSDGPKAEEVEVTPDGSGKTTE